MLFKTKLKPLPEVDTEIFGVDPPEEKIGDDAVTAVTPTVPGLTQVGVPVTIRSICPLVPTMEIRLLEASVARVEEAVREESWREVPVAAPRIGVMRVGVLVRTFAPVPLLVTEMRLLDASVARAEEAVREESWREVPVAAPRIGVMRVGVLVRTFAPVPLLVTEMRLLDASVARAEEAVREESWREVPVAAPRIGVIRVGEVASTI